MQPNPAISVLLPVFNGESFLRDAIASMLAQTLPDFELIVIDDGSSDGTWSVIEECARQDARVLPLRNDRNRGIVESLNRGLAASKGELIARMDADDISLPQRLDRQVAWLSSHPEVGVCGTQVRTVDLGTGATLSVWPPVADDAAIRCRLLWGSEIAHPSVIIRRSAFPSGQLRYDPAYIYAEDYELWARASQFTRLANVPEVLVQMRRHPEASSAVHRAEQLDARTRVQESLLRRMGLDPSSRQMAIHQAMSSRSIPVDREFVVEAEEWLLSMQLAGRASGLYPEPMFSRVLGEAWYMTCRYSAQLGPWVWAKHGRSSLKKRIGPSAQLRFLAATALRGRAR